jgi:hypothetical protein
LPAIYDAASIVPTTDQQKITDCLTIPTQTFEGILNKMNKGNFKLDFPTLKDKDYAKPYLQRGATVLNHHLREGQQTASWYHGPFLTGKNPQAVNGSLPVQSSDMLYQYDQAINMLDVSYAAAWELGKLLIVNNAEVAASLYDGKQRTIAKLLVAERNLVNGHLPFSDTGSDLPVLVDGVAEWFDNLNLLHGVPFNYLVPDRRFLVNNAIRFFEFDNYWIDCLMDGAFSIGRVSKSNLRNDVILRGRGAAPVPKYPAISGFLMRSDLVSGWPSLMIDGYATVQQKDKIDGVPLEILRLEKISPNLLICLFNGSVKTVDVHLKPESLHMGYFEPDTEHPDYYKKLRDLETGAETDKLVAVSWSDSILRIVDMKQQCQKIKQALNYARELDAGQFALEMMAGVPRVRFNVPASNGNNC